MDYYTEYIVWESMVLDYHFYQFFSKIVLRIKVNNTIGDPFTSKIGVPQVGVLCNILMTCSTISPLKVGRFQFADDTSIVVTAQNHSDLSRNCQAAYTAITKWASCKASQSKLLQNGFTCVQRYLRRTDLEL